jgi:hypothetical protein
MSRKPISKTIETEVLTTSRHRCCICYGLEKDANQKRGQIAHLDHHSSNNSIDNLAYLCLPHHDDYDRPASQSKTLSIREVKRYRQELYEHLSNSHPHTAAKAATVLIELDEDLASFTDGRWELFQHGLASFLHVDRASIKLIDKKEGSTLLEIELPDMDRAAAAVQAIRFSHAATNTSLHDFKPVRASLLSIGPGVASRPFTDSEVSDFVAQWFEAQSESTASAGELTRPMHSKRAITATACSTSMIASDSFNQQVSLLCGHQARAGLFVYVASQPDGHHGASARAGGRSRQLLPNSSGRQGACCCVNAESSVVRHPVSLRARLAEASRQ